MATDADKRLMAARTIPLLMRDPVFIKQRMQVADRSKYAVVALNTDLYWDVIEKTRRYPGWVIVFVFTPPPSDSATGEARTDIREVLPRQAQSDDPPPDQTMTVGEAFAMLAAAERDGVDLLARDNDFARSLARQHSVSVG